MKEIDKIALALLPSQSDAATAAIVHGIVDLQDIKDTIDEDCARGAYELAEAFIKVRDERNKIEQKDLGPNG
jgi:hypothetical protein